MSDFANNILEGLDKMAKGTHPITSKEADVNQTQKCYEDTLKMAEVFRSNGREEEAKQYDKQAEMWKKKLDKV